MKNTLIISFFLIIHFVCVGHSRAVEPIILASGLSNPNFLTVDQNNVYWTEVAGSVKNVGLSGGTVTTLTSGGPIYSSTATGITVDNVSVYWAVNPGGGNGNIYKIPISGGTITTLASANQPHDIAVDSTYVYWAENNGGSYGSNAIIKVPIDGGEKIALTTSGTLHGVMATDDVYVYFRYTYNNIWKIAKVNKNGGSVVDLAINVGSFPSGIAVDSDNVYWVEENVGFLKKVPINGGAVTTLASGLDKPQRIAIDTNTIYWTEVGNEGPGDGAIKAVSKDGGVVTTLASGLNYPADIVVDNESIYWTERGTDGAIKKLELGGSTLFQWPVNNPNITQVYACRLCIEGGDRYNSGINVHTGVDVRPNDADRCDYTRPVKAAADGWVENIVGYGNSHGLGNTVVLRHDNDKYSLYGHLDEIADGLFIGKFVAQGSQLGIMGNSTSVPREYCTPEGDGIGTHVHFEIKDNAVLGNITDDGDYWGYTPGHPDQYGYHDPRHYIQNTSIETITPVSVQNPPPGSLNVRGSPGQTYFSTTSTAIIDKISENQEFVAFKRAFVESIYWYYIYLPSTNIPIDGSPHPNNGPNGGWVSGDIVILDPSADQIEVLDDEVRVRSGSGTGFSALAKIYTGERFVTFGAPTSGNGCTTYWYKIYLSENAGASEGWVCGDYLTKELPDSPWPMFGHDPQHTGQSPYVGAQTDNVKWHFEPVQTGSSIRWGIPSIDSNGTIYVGTAFGGWFYAINPNGTQKWTLELSGIFNAPAISSDGTIFASASHGLYAINPDGTPRWEYHPEDGSEFYGSSPSIGLDGTIYITSRHISPSYGNLWAINPDGTLKWKYYSDYYMYGSPAIGKDETIYAGDDNFYFHAINPDGTLKWKFPFPDKAGVQGSSSVGNDGTSYIGTNNRSFYAINQDGTLKWQQSTGGVISGSPAISATGKVYITSGDGNVYAFNPDGNLEWKYQTGHQLYVAPAVGADGSIYLGSGNNIFFAINDDGTLKWRYTTGEVELTYYSSPAIGFDGTVYVGSQDGPFYAFGSSLTNTYSLSGQVSYGETGIEGVTMTLSGQTSDSTPTDPDGDYIFTGLANGSYTLTPSLDGYTFNPASVDVTISGSDVSGIDFRACDTSIPLSGILRDATTNTPLSGVTVTVDGVYSTVTDSNGYYEFSGLSCGDHEIKVDVPSGYSSYIRTMDTSEHQTWDILLTKPETVYGGETPSGYGPDPVNTATGNYIYKKKYLEILGRGMSSVFESHYNSQSDVDGPLGFGWGHTYNVKLTVNADSTVTITWADGKTETWTPDASGGFTPQYGVFDDLIDNGDGTHTLKKKDLTEYGFDASGRLSNIVDKNGNTVSMTYAGNDLTQITDTAGRNIDLTYDGNGRITQITDAIGRTVQFVYDGNGDLVSSTDMNGNTTTYTYDANHQVLTVVDPRGNTVVTNIYDDQKRVVTSQRDAKGGQTTYTYDEINKKTTITDALGYTTIHFHDELLRLIQETDDKSNSAYFTYDEPGNRTEVKDKNGNTSTYTYDTNGNVLTKTDAMGNVTTITYDENNNPLARTDTVGNTTTYECDANGNLIKTTDPLGDVTTMTYNAHGQLLTITDARGNTTTNSYDAEGNLIEVTDALGNKTTYTYDGVGRRLMVTNALGEITAYTYDNNDNLLTVTDPLGNQTVHTYDENNNRLTTTDPMGNTTNYSYDVKDLLTTISDPLANSITNAYDGLDRKTSITDKSGNTTTFSYDAVGNLLTITDPLDNSTTYTYDANGNQLTKTNPLGRTVTYAYNALDRVTSATDPLGNSTTTIYDAIGRVTAETNAKGQATGFEYDPIGRLTKVTDDEGGTVICTYDENGNRLTMKDPNGNTTTYTYDALNRLTQKVEPLGCTHQYAYDAAGNMTSLTDANGNTITYTYDGNNRLTEIKYPDNSNVTFTYDANGNRIQMVDNLGTTNYAYDALNRMASYTDPFGKTVVYGYDANGNRASLTYPDGKMVSYTYDAVNRLTTVTDWLINETIYTYDAAGNLVETLNPNNTKVIHTYDAAERLTGLSNTKSDSSVISSYTYTLDTVGNHTNVVQNEPLAPILASQNIPYTYDVENRLLEAGGTTYSYDANGNLAGKGSDTFTYDYEDRLVQSNIEGTDTQYSYDGLGNRLAKSAGDANTRYVLDINGTLSNVLAETDNTGAVTAYYVYGLGLISKALPDGTTYNYHYDSRGSTVALTDAVQNTTDAYAYDSFGNIVNSNGSSENPFKYVGRYGVMEEGNGLNYIRARYYSPEVGRFITKDPQAGNDRDGQSLNRYVYALNNPVVLIDISGFSAQEGEAALDLTASSDEMHDSLFQMAEPSFATAGSTPEFIEGDYLHDEFISIIDDDWKCYNYRGIRYRARKVKDVHELSLIEKMRVSSN